MYRRAILVSVLAGLLAVAPTLSALVQELEEGVVRGINVQSASIVIDGRHYRLSDELAARYRAGAPAARPQVGQRVTFTVEGQPPVVVLLQAAE